MVLSLSTTEIDESLSDENLLRIYETSRWISPEEISKKFIKPVSKRVKLKKDILEALLGTLDGKKSVWEISVMLRDKQFNVSPLDVYNALEAFRSVGVVRVIGLRPLEVIPHAEIYRKVPIAETIHVPEAYEMEAVISKEEKIKGLPEAPPTIEIQETPPKVVAPPIPEMKIPVEKLTQGVEKIFKRFFAINDSAETALIATHEGIAVAFFSREASEIKEGSLAAASAVILNVAKRSGQFFERGTIDEIIIKAKSGYIIIVPVTPEFVLSVSTTDGARLGMVVRDVKWVSSQIRNIVKSLIKNVPMT